ncbi:UNVERIFIED_ORG: hypothetical protein ABID33_003006 [Xanthobacter viscosus]|jgi:hypothetical protein|uniref:hypothetical protein n=1 Tax=Xanthobacter autotrophicus TaxID=280 RepID=UPI0014778112|nr:hypothetical protein [Xanthobacter autotrophicus]
MHLPIKRTGVCHSLERDPSKLNHLPGKSRGHVMMLHKPTAPPGLEASGELEA